MKRKFIHLILAFAASCMSLFAQGVTVTLTTDTGMSRPAGISKAEQNLGIVLWKSMPLAAPTAPCKPRTCLWTSLLLSRSRCFGLT